MSGQQLLKMPEPTHNDIGVPCSTLKIVKEIKSDFDKDIFFAMPFKLTVGENGIFYVYDIKLVKVFIFNKNYEYIGQFLEQGQGPGEVLPGYAANIDLYAAKDGNLYLCAALSDKLIQFSAGGKYLKDIKLNRLWKSRTPFPPVKDSRENYYAYSINGGIVDKLDSQMKRVKTFLDKELNRKFVIYKPPFEECWKKWPDPDFWLLPYEVNTMYDLTSDGHLLIYLFRSSTVFLLKDDKVIRKFDILIDRVLPVNRKRAEIAYRKQKTIDPQRYGVKRAIMFKSCFVDQDEPYFYLQFLEENKTNTLFQFDLKGKLVRVITNNAHHALIKTKRNNLFYGLSYTDKHPVIFKMEETQ
jgi:hypothetical protein